MSRLISSFLLIVLYNFSKFNVKRTRDGKSTALLTTPFGQFFVIIIRLFFTASGLKCYECEGTNAKPQCINATEECGTTETQCIAYVEEKGDTKTYKKGCALPGACTTNEASCKARKLLNQLDGCAYECCDSDLCNKEFPSLNSGVQAASGLVAIGTTLVFALFLM